MLWCLVGAGDGYEHMVVMETIGVTLLITMICVLVMVFWMAVHANKYFDTSNEQYVQMTFGGANPLNAIFSSELLSDEGLRWRSLIGKVVAVIWVMFVVVVVIESFLM